MEHWTSESEPFHQHEEKIITHIQEGLRKIRIDFYNRESSNIIHRETLNIIHQDQGNLIGIELMKTTVVINAEIQEP